MLRELTRELQGLGERLASAARAHLLLAAARGALEAEEERAEILEGILADWSGESAADDPEAGLTALFVRILASEPQQSNAARQARLRVLLRREECASRRRALRQEIDERTRSCAEPTEIGAWRARAADLRASVPEASRGATLDRLLALGEEAGRLQAQRVALDGASTCGRQIRRDAQRLDRGTSAFRGWGDWERITNDGEDAPAPTCRLDEAWPWVQSLDVHQSRLRREITFLDDASELASVVARLRLVGSSAQDALLADWLGGRGLEATRRVIRRVVDDADALLEALAAASQAASDRAGRAREETEALLQGT